MHSYGNQNRLGMAPENTVAFALGSNLGDRAAYLAAACDRLLSLGGLAGARFSGVYETSPLGPDQPPYLNQVVAGRSGATPERLLRLALEIEAMLGRTRSGVRWGPRTIDIDLLAVGGARRDEPDFVLPHPGIAARRFVLEPWGEIDPGFVVPGLERSVAELLAELIASGDRSRVALWSPPDPARRGSAP